MLKTDTILWQIPNNSCGTFKRYEIYSSTNINETFQLLTNISNQNQTSFIDKNPMNENRYYFMKSNFDCPGEVVLNSDTISNQPLGHPVLQFVSVEDNGIHIQWKPSSSPQTKFYVIYRVQTQGTYPIDTINTNQYIDWGIEGSDQPEIYFVVALDACDNTSIFGKPHFSTFVEGVIDSCTNDIFLEWNIYKNSIYGIDYQEIWVNDNGWKLWETIPSTDSTFIIEGLEADHSYDIFIKSIEKTTKFEINSNIIELQTLPLVQLTIVNISNTVNNEIIINWIWNEKQHLQNLKLSKNGNFQSESVMGIPNIINEIKDLPATSKNSYQLVEDRNCIEKDISNKACNIFLSGSFVNTKTNQLSWSEFNIEGAEFMQYEVYRVDDSSPISIQNETSFQDENSLKKGSESYYIMARGEITLYNGEVIPIKSRSNTIKITKESKIFLPNAFAPFGSNRFFKPSALSPENISEYEMKIYDRWGKELFFSDDLEIGWDGYYKGKLLEMGVYTFTIQFRQNNQTIIEKGVVMLIN